MKQVPHKKKSSQRTIILVSVFVVLLLSYFNLNYLKEKFRSFSIEKENRWSIVRTTLPGDNLYYRGKEAVSITSPVFHIDTVFRALEGPSETFFFKPGNTQKSGIIWLTDYEVKAVDAAGEKELGNDFIGHNNLDIAYSELIRSRSEVFNNRLIMVTPGQLQLHFPAGFGLPMLSHDNISVTTRVINYNTKNISQEQRQKVILGFVRDNNIRQPLRPLFKRTVNVFVAVDTCEQQSAGCCDSGMYCREPVQLNLLNSEKTDGKMLTGYWYIPPGKDTVKYDITQGLRIPYSTTLHYASVHSFPFCERLVLRDKTAGKVIFDSEVKNYKDKVGIQSTLNFSSVEGVMIDHTHRYELICLTNNPTASPQEMIAGMILYFNDKELEKKLAEAPARNVD